MQTVLTRKEVAERLGADEQTIRKWEQEGILNRLPKFPTPRYSLKAIEELEGGGETGRLKKYQEENEALRQENKWLRSKLDMAKEILGG